MNKVRFIIIILFVFAMRFAVYATKLNEETSKNYAIINVSIVDVENGSILKNRTVETKDGVIFRITLSSERKESKNSEVIDGTGLFVVPGLIDSHIHYYDPETFGKMLIANGVVFVREMGNITEEAIKQRNSLNNGTLFGPEMITTGSFLDGHPAFIPQISIECNTPEEGRTSVRKQIAAGVDEIKTYSRLEKEVFLAIVDECKKNGIKAVGHVPETVYIEDAAKIGLSSSEHLFGFGNVIAKVLNLPIKLKAGGMGADQDQFLNYPKINKKQLLIELKKISGFGMAVCPTMIVTKCGTNLVEIYNHNYPGLEYISPVIWNIWKMWEPQKQNIAFFKQLFPYYKSMLKDLYDANFTLLVGTDLLDPGVIPGYSVHEEMNIWQDSGIPAIDILRSATIIPAKFFGIDKTLGSIEEGKKASFILLRANPLTDINNIDQIESVFFRGHYFTNNDLKELKNDVKMACKEVK